ncbi:hypothetical protein [Glycomyces artemisiae]|uniref:Uncharacterized protein n=1 Tax=Glycomyces artemisiae TaxID=1076443 RepID=A0A2T0UJ40_9ACTN|nr:hypothetical protein [Glycomyces artemisiae]PRY57955.1 hypothetical protein B0I28_106379 [Glycomyces artemisiae]
MRALLALTSLLAALVLAGCTDEARDALRPSQTGCYFTTGIGETHLTSEQAANAATISAVGLRDGMDERAVAVAITTAMQESELKNVEYGHDDSLGLFQQRPSMGWGSEEELMDPVYASFKFYEKLRRTDGWEDMTLAEAAQAVQVSAYPDLYEQWEEDATVIAAVFAGGKEGGIGCVKGNAPEVTADPELLAEAFAYHWGAEVSEVDGTTVVVDPSDAAEGWNRAAWAVARSYDYSITSVAYGGMVWAAGEDGWTEPNAEEDGEDAVAVANDSHAAVIITFAAA